MSDAVVVSLIGGLALILSGVLVEMVRTRRRADIAAHEVRPNSGDSLRDVVNRIDERMVTAGKRAVRTEGKVDKLADQLSDHLTDAAARDRRIERIMRHLELPDA